MLKNYIVVPKNYVIVIIIIDIKKVRTFEKKAVIFSMTSSMGKKSGFLKKAVIFSMTSSLGKKSGFSGTCTPCMITWTMRVGIFRHVHPMHDHVDSVWWGAQQPKSREHCRCSHEQRVILCLKC